MRPSLIVLTDLVPPPPGTGAERMPALERLLARADDAGHVVPDWRAWVQSELGISTPPGPLPLANVARGLPGQWAFATPVHLIAGLESLHLHPSLPLALLKAEQDELVRGFAPTFGPELALAFDADGVAYLGLPQAIDVVTHDPAAVAGRAVGDWLPSGAASGWLTRLATEIQMWLHGLPLNQAREARGEPVVNALWLWGVSSAPAPVLPATLPPLWSRDPYLAGLWRLNGSRRMGVAEESDVWLADRSRPAVVTLSIACTGGTPAGLDRQWFSPLTEWLARAGGSARLWAAGRVFQLAGSQRVRLWRRARPWHEVLAA